MSSRELPSRQTSIIGHSALVIILGLLTGLVAVSGESYWIDEASTLDKSIQPSLSAWWERLRWEGSSNLQLPLYLLYAWGWEKLFGPGEWVTRAANIPWFVLGLVATDWSFARLGRCRFLASLAAASSAFLWYYVNEARPYAMQFGAASVVFAALIRLSDVNGSAVHLRDGDRRWVVALALGAVFLSASGMLAMLWLGGGLLAAAFAYGWSRTRWLLIAYWKVWAATSMMFLIIGGYYLWTLTLGARATLIASTDIKSLIFTAYEMLGLLGLGPSRLELRSGNVAVVKPYLASIAFYLVLMVLIWNWGWFRLKQFCSTRTILCVVAGCVAVALFLIAVGISSRFRLLGRHCIPLAPVILYPLGCGLASAWERRGWAGRSAVAGFVLLGLTSCLLLRFDLRHAKDDYRGAARLARQAAAKGEVVWWNADEQAALFYGVSLVKDVRVGFQVVHVEPYRNGFEVGLGLPDVVFTSKADVYDPQSLLSSFLSRNDFQMAGQLTAFTIWRRRP